MTDILPKEIKLVAIYARVSTSRQEKEETIDNQLKAMRKLAKEKGYKIVKEYIDDGWSGDLLARPALDQLREDAKKKIWEEVLFHDPDRVARTQWLQGMVMYELEELGLGISFITTAAPKSDEDKVVFAMRGVFAQYEKMKITERMRMGKRHKAEEGHLLVSRPLYGYKYIRKKERKHGYYKINFEEARIVKMIFSWVTDEGLTIRKVVRRLQELGIKPRYSKRSVWNTSTLGTMLRNKAYIGEAHWGSSYAVIPEKPFKNEKYKKVIKSSRKIKPEQDWIIIPVPKIIEKEQFERAREQLKTNFALCQRNKKNDYLLAGKIRCICGRTRSGEGPQHGKHLYYRCADRVKSFPCPPTCHEKGINARIADRLLWDKVAELMSSPDLLQAQLDRWINARRSKAISSIGDVKALGSEITELKHQLDRFNRGFGAGSITLEELRAYTIPLREDIASLEAKIAKAKEQENQINEAAMPSREDIKSFTEESERALPDLSFELKRNIIINVIEKIIGTQQKLEVNGYMPMASNLCLAPNYRSG